MNDITFVFFTYNEEKRISFAIQNFIKYGDVIVLDGGSNDKTKEIAENLGARFYLRPASNKAQVETQDNFEFVKSKINTNWIYWGYVDNIAPKSLIEKFVETTKQNKFKIVLTPLYTYLWGNTKNFAHRGYTQMFFHKDYIDFSDNVIHHMGKFIGADDQILRLPDTKDFALIHFSTYNISKFVTGHLKYAESEALDKQRSGERFSVVKMLAAMIRYCWIFGKDGYKNGVLGLITMLSYSFSRFMTYARLYEIEHGITLDVVEKKYSIVKEEMLKEFK